MFRNVVGTFIILFNGEVQCTIDCTCHVLPTLTDSDVHVSEPLHTESKRDIVVL